MEANGHVYSYLRGVRGVSPRIHKSQVCSCTCTPSHNLLVDLVIVYMYIVVYVISTSTSTRRDSSRFCVRTVEKLADDKKVCPKKCVQKSAESLYTYIPER